MARKKAMSGLAAQGVTVHVATTDDDGPDSRLPVPLGIGMADSGGLCFYFPRQTSFYTFSWPLFTWLRQHIREYDLVHIHALFSYPSTVAALIARSAGVPYLLRPLGTLAKWGLTTRRPLLKSWSLALIERRLMRGAAAVQATSEQERQEVLDVCRSCRVVVIPNPVEVPVDPIVRPARERMTTILFLSRIDPKKGLEILLSAFDQAAMNNPGLKLVIAGDGAPTYVASIRTLAASLANRDKIRFVGNVEGGAKSALFAEADLFVLPSYSENFGVAVVEAMAHSVPVLISANVGIHCEVTGADAGRTAECAVTPLTQMILEMLGNPGSLVRMGNNGRRLAFERYLPEVVARQLITQYETAIAAAGTAKGASIV